MDLVFFTLIGLVLLWVAAVAIVSDRPPALLARAVLATWGIRSTDDFGRIVFAMIDAGLLQKQPDDTIADFADVFDFRTAFEAAYTIRLPERLHA